MLKVERVTPELTQKSTDSGRSRNRKLVSDESALELELDINEMQELHTMSMRPLVRNTLASVRSLTRYCEGFIPYIRPTVRLFYSCSYRQGLRDVVYSVKHHIACLVKNGVNCSKTKMQWSGLCQHYTRPTVLCQAL